MSARIIYCHNVNSPLEELARVWLGGRVTDVMLKNWHRTDDTLTHQPDPTECEAVRFCQRAKVPIWWSRWLWPGYDKTWDTNNLYSADWYAGELQAIEAEQNKIGAKYAVLNTEVYGDNPLRDRNLWPHTVMDVKEWERVYTAATVAKRNVGVCDYIWPASYKAFQFAGAFELMGKYTIGQQMYDLSFKRLEQMPSDVFMASCGIVEPVSSPKFDVLDLLGKNRGIWERCRGVLIYPDGATQRERVVEQLASK